MAKMTPYKRAVATTGTYTDRNGAEKKRYLNIGTLFKYEDGGFALKLDAVPVGDGFNGFVSFYDIEDKASGAESRSDGRPDLSDDIPY